MNQDQIVFTMWSREDNFAQMRVYYKITRLSEDLSLYATKFILEHNKKSICFWNVRFLQTKPTIPRQFFEQFSNCILINRRLLSNYGIREEDNFYNNLEFDGSEIEANSAKEFSSQCETAGMIFLDEKYLAVPNSTDVKVESGDVIKETPAQTYYGYPSLQVNEISKLKSKWEFDRLRKGEQVSHRRDSNGQIEFLKLQLGKMFFEKILVCLQ